MLFSRHVWLVRFSCTVQTICAGGRCRDFPTRHPERARKLRPRATFSQMAKLMRTPHLCSDVKAQDLLGKVASCFGCLQRVVTPSLCRLQDLNRSGASRDNTVELYWILFVTWTSSPSVCSPASQRKPVLCASSCAWTSSTRLDVGTTQRRPQSSFRCRCPGSATSHFSSPGAGGPDQSCLAIEYIILSVACQLPFGLLYGSSGSL